MRGNKVGCNMRMINNQSLLTCMRYATEQISSDFDELIDELINAISDVMGDSADTTAEKE